jgi:hypothetical protein
VVVPQILPQVLAGIVDKVPTIGILYEIGEKPAFLEHFEPKMSENERFLRILEH